MVYENAPVDTKIYGMVLMAISLPGSYTETMNVRPVIEPAAHQQGVTYKTLGGYEVIEFVERTVRALRLVRSVSR